MSVVRSGHQRPSRSVGPAAPATRQPHAVSGRDRAVTTAIDRVDGPAETAACARCTTPGLLLPGWCCPDCIAAMGLFHPEQHAAWREDVKRKIAGLPRTTTWTTATERTRT
jgi:hypothetical protein